MDEVVGNITSINVLNFALGDLWFRKWAENNLK